MSQFRWLGGGKAALGDAAADLVNRVAAEVLAETVARCPVDTGTLAGSYTATWANRTRPEAVVGTSIAYAPFVEFGTSRTRAQPHLGPAVERARRKYG